MKKTIRLTESDLTKIVKRVMNESPGLLYPWYNDLYKALKIMCDGGMSDSHIKDTVDMVLGDVRKESSNSEY